MSSSGKPISRAPAAVLVVGLLLAVGLVFLGASLASAPAPAPGIERPGTPDWPRDVTVILRDYAFNPDPLHLVAGETVRLTVVNGGLIEHEFVLGDASVQSAWAEADARASAPAPFATSPPASVSAEVGGLRLLVGSGQTVVALHDVPAAHGLELACHLPGHLQQGMRARVVLAVANMSGPET